MSQPTNFAGAPAYGSAHPPATPAGEWKAVPVAVPLPRSVPTLTVQPDGFAWLNAEASGLAAGFPGFCLRAPPAVRAGRTPQLWELGPGECCDAHPHRDKQQIRFRFDPEQGPPAGRYALMPVAGASNRFTLYPV